MSAKTTAPPAIEASNPEVDDPTDLEWADYKAALVATKDEIKRDDVPSLAAGVAFKIFLAFFPSLIAAVAIFGFFTDPAQLDRYLDRLAGLVPGDALSILEGALTNIAQTDSGAARGLAITGILAGLWAASSAAVTLIKSLNRAYEVEESRNFAKQRGIALAITLGLLAAIGALVALVIAGPQIQRILVPEQVQGPIANVAFGILQVVIVVAVLVAFFAFVYWIGPNRDLPRWVWMSPGALLGVVGWLLASLGFTLYVQNFGNYGEGSTYAGLGGVIVLMLWLQISMMLLLIGAEFNAEVERIKARRRDVRSGAGMGHMDELSEAGAEAESTLLLPGSGLPPLREPEEVPAQTIPQVAIPSSTGNGSSGAPAPAEIDLPADASARPVPSGGNRALVAGAAAAAAVAAVVTVVRSRD